MKYVQITLVHLLFMRETPSAKNMFNFSCVCPLYPSYFIIVQCFNIMKNCKTVKKSTHLKTWRQKFHDVCDSAHHVFASANSSGKKGGVIFFLFIFRPNKEKIKQTIWD